jgi:hypothetical protein
METQNITLAMPKDILHKVELLATERQTSLSSLLTQMIVDVVNKQDRYRVALDRQIAWLEQGFDLGTGAIAWQREDLYDR